MTRASNVFPHFTSLLSGHIQARFGSARTVLNQCQSGEIVRDLRDGDWNRGRCGLAFTYFSQLARGQVVSAGGELDQRAGDVGCSILEGISACRWRASN